MRQSQQKNNNNRMRGRGRKQPNQMSRSFESNGPDVKIRGNAPLVAEKYTQLARDALTSGDRVMAENYLQHAEHYNRIIAAAAANSVRDGDPNATQRIIQPEFGGPAYDDEDEDEGDDLRSGNERRPSDLQPATNERPQEREEYRDRQDNRPRHDNRDRNENRQPRQDNRERSENPASTENRELRPENRNENRNDGRNANRDRPQRFESRPQPLDAPQDEHASEKPENRPQREARTRRPRPAPVAHNGNDNNAHEPPTAASPIAGISSDASKLPGSLFGAGPEALVPIPSDE